MTESVPATVASPATGWLRARASQPVDIAWLATFRILFGLTMCVSMLRFLGYGWVERFWVTPTFHFKYWGFAWAKPFPGQGMYVFFACLALLAGLVALGLFYRVAAPLFALGFLYLQLLDVTTYLNHYYLAVLLAGMLALSPAHEAWSVDAWRKGKHRADVPMLWLSLFRLQIGVVYTFAGIAKLHGDWLLHAQPLQIWLGSRSELPLLGVVFTFEHAALLMSWAGFLFDTFIVWLLLYRPLRPFAYLAVIVFHVATRTLFPIGMFSLIMVLSAAVFFPPGWARAWLRVAQKRFRGRGETAGVTLEAARAPNGASSRRPPVSRVALWAFVAYAGFQILFPLRFLVYGGNVRWHEQGMRFSWRVMVREKNGTVTFVARNSLTGKTWEVPPRTYLTRLQEREMGGQPDLILQLAHHIRDDLDARGLGPVEVRAETLVSLNGRPAVPMIDPTRDLASIADGLRPADWILEAPDSPPPRVKAVASRSSR